MITTITLKKLNQRGYKSVLNVYHELNPSFCERLYTRPVRSGVRDALRHFLVEPSTRLPAVIIQVHQVLLNRQ